MQEQGRKWELQYWHTPNGSCPVCDFMHGFRSADPVRWQLVRTKIARFQSHDLIQVISAGDLEDLKNGLWEFKINVAKIHIRMLGTLHRGDIPPLFIALHGIKKAQRKLDKNDIKIALDRLKQKI